MIDAHPLAVFTVLAALAVGSFLGVLVLRLVEGRPVALARSSCPCCGHQLGARDLVPLVSWLWTRGRCRYCRESIGWFYPAIELAAVGVVLWAAAVTSGWLFWASCVLGWTLLALAVIDWREFVLPDALTLPLIPAGLAVAWLIDPALVPHHAIGAVAGFAVFALVAWIYGRVRGRDGLGLGDAKLLAAAGAWVSWVGLPSVVLLAGAGALAVALIGAAAAGGLPARERAIAFGPYLALAVWFVWLHGPIVIG